MRRPILFSKCTIPNARKSTAKASLIGNAGPEGGPENTEPELCGRDVIVHASTQR